MDIRRTAIVSRDDGVPSAERRNSSPTMRHNRRCRHDTGQEAQRTNVPRTCPSSLAGGVRSRGQMVRGGPVIRALFVEGESTKRTGRVPARSLRGHGCEGGPRCWRAQRPEHLLCLCSKGDALQGSMVQGPPLPRSTTVARCSVPPEACMSVSFV